MPKQKRGSLTKTQQERLLIDSVIKDLENPKNRDLEWTAVRMWLGNSTEESRENAPTTEDLARILLGSSVSPLED